MTGTVRTPRPGGRHTARGTGPGGSPRLPVRTAVGQVPEGPGQATLVPAPVLTARSHRYVSKRQGLPRPCSVRHTFPGPRRLLQRPSGHPAGGKPASHLGTQSPRAFALGRVPTASDPGRGRSMRTPHRARALRPAPPRRVRGGGGGRPGPGPPPPGPAPPPSQKLPQPHRPLSGDPAPARAQSGPVSPARAPRPQASGGHASSSARFLLTCGLRGAGLGAGCTRLPPRAPAGAARHGHAGNVGGRTGEPAWL